MGEQIKKNKGITMIALVITIIILLIIVGISIASLTGENGILGKATTAKKETTWGGEEEEIKIAYNGAITEKLGMGNVIAKDLNAQFKANSTNATAEDEGDGNIKVIFNETLNQYIIDKKGGITLLDEKAEPDSADDDTIVSMTKSELKKLIKDEVNLQLSSNGTIKTEESSITLKDPDNWNVQFNKVIKTGNQCTILFGGTYKDNFNNTSTVIGKLPYIPKYIITDSGAVSTIDIHQIRDMLYVYLGTNGNINVADWGSTNGKTIVINTTYICE